MLLLSPAVNQVNPVAQHEEEYQYSEYVNKRHHTEFIEIEEKVWEAYRDKLARTGKRGTHDPLIPIYIPCQPRDRG